MKFSLQVSKVKICLAQLLSMIFSFLSILNSFWAISTISYTQGFSLQSLSLRMSSKQKVEALWSNSVLVLSFSCFQCLSSMQSPLKLSTKLRTIVMFPTFSPKLCHPLMNLTYLFTPFIWFEKLLFCSIRTSAFICLQNLVFQSLYCRLVRAIRSQRVLRFLRSDRHSFNGLQFLLSSSNKSSSSAFSRAYCSNLSNLTQY